MRVVAIFAKRRLQRPSGFGVLEEASGITEILIMKFALTIFLSFFICLASWANQEDEIRKLVENYAKSVNTLDMDLAGSIWSQSEDVTFIQPRGHQKGWDHIKNHFYLGAMNNFSKRDLKVKNLSIRMLSDNSAWGEFYWEFNATFKKDGKPLQSKGRETQVWKKEKGSWKIVHVHYSSMPVTGEREGF